MQALLHLIQRNNKLFRRDKTLMFFSLLSVFIVLILYVIFLQKMQLDSIASMISVTNGIKTLVNEWMAAGMLSIMSVTTTLSALGLYIRDREEGGFLDLLTTPVRAMQLQLSYVANAWIIGMLFTCIGLFICELYIVFSGGEWLEASSLLQVLAIIALGVTVSSVMNCMLILFINGQSAFSTLSTIVGTAIGFLCGVYVPMGVLPDFVQKIILAFPISHYTVLLRQVMMDHSLSALFTDSMTRTEYERIYGVVLVWQNDTLPSIYSMGYLVISLLVFLVISLWLFKRQNRSY